MHEITIPYPQISKRLLKYFTGTAVLGIFYPRRSLVTAQSIVATVYADWSGDNDTRRLTMGPVLLDNGSPVYSKAKRQTFIDFSSGESKYKAMFACARESFT